MPAYQILTIMNSRLSFFIIAMLGLTFTACSESDFDEESSIDSSSSDAYVDASTGDDLESFDVAFDYTSLDEDSETIPTDESDSSYDDYVENSTFNQTVYISFSDGSASVTGSTDDLTVSIDGAHVVVTSSNKKMEYVLSGEASDGEFKIYSDYKFKLTLAGLTLTNPEGAAINVQSKKRVFVCLSDGTTNTLTDGTTYTTTDGEDMKACLFSEGQLLFSGSGTLNVTGQYKHGICSDDYIRLRPGSIINITASAGNGMKANDGVFICGGVLNISTSAAASKGISSDGSVEISGGRTTIITTGGGELDDDDVSACAGVKSDGHFSMTDGQLLLKSTGAGGKGLSCDSIINISGGTIEVITTGKQYTYGNLDTSAKGIKADGNLYISGGSIKVRTSGGEGSEGIESKAAMGISGGTVEVSAYDDCLNASSAISISGGSIYAYSTNNDAIDSNGTLSISGGTVVAVGTQTPEGAFDCDQNTFAITGGTIVGVGGDLSQPTTSATTQATLLYNGSASAGVYLALLGSGSSPIMSYKIPISYSQMAMLMSSPDLSTGSTYTLSAGGQASGGTSFHGLTIGGSWSDATSSASVTFSSAVTSYGSSSSFGQGGGGTMPGGGGGHGGR